MYDEMIKRLREPCQYENCILCQQAADAIEELQADKAALNGTVSNLIQQIEELSKPPWIPVSERLPKEMETVIVTDGKNVGWSFCVNDYGTMEFYSPWKITHWMPFPQKPKGE